MRRLFVLLIVFVCMSTAFTGVVLAGSAPAAMSYFTNPNYNKTYTADDGLQHTMSVKWVGETWNKVGTVIYSINFEDVYQKDESTYIDVKSETEIFENARPKYPDSPKHIVYQLKWYPDGRSEIVSDYRPAETPSPKAHPTPASTTRPTTPVPTKAPTAKPIQKPTAKPTTKATAVATEKMPSISTAAPTATPIPTVKATSTHTPSPSPATTAWTSLHMTVAPVNEEPEVTEQPVQSGSIHNSSLWNLVWVTIAISAIALTFLVVCSLKNRKKKKQ